MTIKNRIHQTGQNIAFSFLFSHQPPVLLQDGRTVPRYGGGVVRPDESLALLRVQRPQPVRVGRPRPEESGQGLLGPLPLGLRVERGGRWTRSAGSSWCVCVGGGGWVLISWGDYTGNRVRTGMVWNSRVHAPVTASALEVGNSWILAQLHG